LCSLQHEIWRWKIREALTQVDRVMLHGQRGHFREGVRAKIRDSPGGGFHAA
jgi:hypothetical protein